LKQSILLWKGLVSIWVKKLLFIDNDWGYSNTAVRSPFGRSNPQPLFFKFVKHYK
jgi:hypothetical protein